MSYIKDLDEVTDKELETELFNRRVMRENGICDYCGRTEAKPECRFPERHRAAMKNQRGL